MKLPTKRNIKSFLRRFWNGKELILLAIIIVGTAWLMARMAYGIERHAANKGSYFPQSELKIVYNGE